MRYLITGGAGFIGSALARMLVARADSVVVIDKLTYAADLRTLDPIRDSGKLRFEQIDICDAPALSRILARHSPSIIFHLAAESHVDRSITGSRPFIWSNVVGTHELLDCARSYWRELDDQSRGKFRFVHASTDEVYGALGSQGSFTEDSPYRPASPYAASKAAADHLVRAWHHTYGLPVIITNCSNNYGPFQYPEKLVPTVIRSALRSAPIPVYGNGENVRDWIYVDDHARALITVAEKGQVGATYNIGAASEKRNIDLVREICALLDRHLPRQDGQSYAKQISFVNDRPGHDFRYAIDAGKIRSELGWAPVETFSSALEKTVIWYQHHRDWWEHKAVADARPTGQVL